ncbi:MAG: hypothetical protein U1F76_02915 [Candidatus Competibacteraceae bacterium]
MLCYQWLIGLVLGVALANTAWSEPTEQMDNPMAVSVPACKELFPCLTAFRQDLERLRFIMGETRPPPLDISLRNATPYDVYFQSLALLQRTNRLAFEFMRVVEKPLPPPPTPIELSDALPLVREAYRIFKDVLTDPQIQANFALAPPPSAGAGEVPATGSANEAFVLLFGLNRQLNLVLERYFSPSDNYKQVTLAVAYATQVLARYPDAIRLPEEPPFEPGKQPIDSLLKLITCLQSLGEVLHNLGLPAPIVETQALDTAPILPGDVFLIASLVVGQLEFLRQQLGIAKPPREVFYPGRKFPTDVYRRVGLLQAQLVQLARQTAAHGAPAIRN